MNIIVKVLAVAILSIVVGCSDDGTVSMSDLRDGDLLFVVNENDNNITEVTQGTDNLKIDHVAIFAEGNIIEAIPELGVMESPLDSFLVGLNEKESVLVGRVKGLDAKTSVDNARGFLGLPYDDIFMPGDSAIYCSELVQMSFVFKRKSSGSPSGYTADNLCPSVVFGTIPMSFHDSTGNVTEFWTKFYAARGMAVPEGTPGTNPGQLSRDPNVKILGYLK